MSIPVIAFFNNRSGVGTSISMVYHLSWMFADRGLRVVATDLDPQVKLTGAFLDDDQLEGLLTDSGDPRTIFGALQPLKRGTGDIVEAHLEPIADNLVLIPGDMALSAFEEPLSTAWSSCMDREERSFRITSAFWRVMQKAGERHEADVIMVDLGPNLGAINRAAVIAADYVVFALGADLFSIQSLRILGPTLRRWCGEWQDRVTRNPVADLPLPTGRIAPLGYVMLLHALRLDRPVKPIERWIAEIPGAFAEAVLDQAPDPAVTLDTDPKCLARLKDYRSLLSLAQEAQKPMFFLRAADGALGAHSYAVSDAYRDFKAMASKIAAGAGLREMA